MMNQAKSGGYKFLAIKDRDCLLGSNGQISLEDREALLEVQEEYALRGSYDEPLKPLRAATTTTQ